MLDPDDGCEASVLFKGLDARLARGEGDRADLLLVREKLERAWIRANAEQLTRCSIMAQRLRGPVSDAADLLPIPELLARLPG